MEPLVFAILKRLTPPDDEALLFDECLELIPFDAQAHLVGVSVEAFTARRAYQIAGEFRRRGIPVVMGGFHATLVSDECLQHADP